MKSSVVETSAIKLVTESLQVKSPAYVSHLSALLLPILEHRKGKVSARIVNRPRLFRAAAFCDATIALLVGVLSAAELYIIRTGQFQNSNWVEPNAWARTQEWGLLFALLCMSSGYGLWRPTNWARWLELLLILPKLYCGYFELLIFKMSNSIVSLLIILLIFASLACTLFLWVPMRSVESNPDTRNG